MECGLFYGSTRFAASLYENKSRSGSRDFTCSKKCFLLGWFRCDSGRERKVAELEIIIKRNHLCVMPETQKKTKFILCQSSGCHVWNFHHKEKLYLYQSVSALNFIPSNCICMSKAVICNYLNLTSVPEIPPQSTSIFLIGNRLQLTVNSFNDLNLTQSLYVVGLGVLLEFLL